MRDTIVRTALSSATRRSGITVFVEVRLSTRSANDLRAFERAVSRMPDVIECFLMTGDADYLLRVAADDVRSFHQFLDTTLRRIKGVLATKSSVAMRQVKQPVGD